LVLVQRLELVPALLELPVQLPVKPQELLQELLQGQPQELQLLGLERQVLG
jgi:hypothetical protein